MGAGAGWCANDAHMRGAVCGSCAAPEVIERAVSCPVGYCRARPGQECVSKTGRVVAVHPARKLAAREGGAK